MDDATTRRDGSEVIEVGLPPLEEGIPLAIALIFDGHIPFASIFVPAGDVDLHGVVDHEVDGNLWVDLGRVPAEICHGIAQSCDIYDSGNAGEVLQDDAARLKRNLTALPVGLPACEIQDVFVANQKSIVIAECGFEQHADGERKSGEVGVSSLLEGCQSEE